MLVLTRTAGSSTYVGDDIEVIPLKWEQDRVRMLILVRNQVTIVQWIDFFQVFPIVSGISIRVVEIRPQQIRIDFVAPPFVHIAREEVSGVQFKELNAA